MLVSALRTLSGTLASVLISSVSCLKVISLSKVTPREVGVLLYGIEISLGDVGYVECLSERTLFHRVEILLLVHGCCM